MINNIIARSSTNKKVIDFRDGLVLAKPDDYAMIFGVGGGKHAPVAVVKVTICDFSAGAGEGKSITANANLELDAIAMLRAAAEQKLLNPVTSQRGSAPQPQGQKGVVLSDDAWAALTEVMRQAGNAAKAKQGLTQDELIKLGTNLRIAYDAGKKSRETPPAQTAPVISAGPEPGAADFAHSQVRINIYKKGADGLPANYAPVSRLTITHTPIDKSGRTNGYPWVVKIGNGSAQVNEAENGATSYASSTYKETQSVFMNISDVDMFRMMDACQRYIDVYSMCFGIPLVRDGVNRRLAELNEWKNAQT